MHNLELKDAHKNAQDGLVVRIDPTDEEKGKGMSGEIFLPKMDLSTPNMFIGKKYYLLSEDEYTPPVTTPDT